MLAYFNHHVKLSLNSFSCQTYNILYKSSVDKGGIQKCTQHSVVLQNGSLLRFVFLSFFLLNYFQFS